jgi:hypothetical protein
MNKNEETTRSQTVMGASGAIGIQPNGFFAKILSGAEPASSSRETSETSAQLSEPQKSA